VSIDERLANPEADYPHWLFDKSVHASDCDRMRMKRMQYCRSAVTRAPRGARRLA
jgi:hypothetical protein